MPSRTSVRKPSHRVTNEDLALAIGGVKEEIAELKEIVKTSGLNGYSSDFRAMVEEYRAERKLSAARQLVRAERAKSLGWLREPKRIAGMLFAAVVGAFGWKVVSGIHLPW